MSQLLIDGSFSTTLNYEYRKTNTSLPQINYSVSEIRVYGY